MLYSRVFLLCVSLLPLAAGCDGPTIDVQPAAVNGCAGQTVTLAIDATAGTGVLSYQWLKDCEALPGETSSTLTFDPLTTQDMGTYACVVSDDCGSLTSEGAAITATETFSLTGQPESMAACVGDSVSFSVSTTGGNPSYQWRVDCVPLVGENQATLAIPSVALADSGSYSCVIADACISVTSQPANLLVGNNNITVAEQPTDVDACLNGEASFTFIVTGDPVLYQWYKDSEPLAGETGETLSLEHLTAADAGSFQCVATHGCGTLESDLATLSVHEGLTITTAPQPQVVCEGEPLTLSVGAFSSQTLSYQWRVDCEAIAGANTAELTIPSFNSSNVGTYSCTVYDACSSVTTEGVAALLGINCNSSTPDPILRDFFVNGSWFDEEGNPFPIDANGDGSISQQEALMITGTLDCSKLGLTDLTGIGAFTNLTGLDCSDNLLTSLPADLALLTMLQELDLSGNRLTQWSTEGAPLLPDTLEDLALDYNGLVALPDLSKLPNLHKISATHNRLSNVSVLADNRGLGNDPDDEVILDHNLLETDDCVALDVLTARAGSSGSELSINPQFDFTQFPNWGTLTILNLIDRWHRDLICGSP